jgi:hypothetical protein
LKGHSRALTTSIKLRLPEAAAPQKDAEAQPFDDPMRHDTRGGLILLVVLKMVCCLGPLLLVGFGTASIGALAANNRWLIFGIVAVAALAWAYHWRAQARHHSMNQGEE